MKCLYQYLQYTQVLTHPNIVPVSRSTRTPVEAVKPVVRLAGVRLCVVRISGLVATVDSGIVVICAVGLMKLVVLVAGVCDVIASTCVAEGHTVPLTVWVIGLDIGQRHFEVVVVVVEGYNLEHDSQHSFPS